MKLKLSAIVLLFGFLNCFGQDKDSLLNVIKKYKKNDTLHCFRLTKLIEIEYDVNIWPTYNEKLKSIVTEKINSNFTQQQKLPYYKYYGSYFDNKGFEAFENNNFDEAILYRKKAISIFKKYGFVKNIPTVLQKLSLSYYKKGDVKLAINYQKQALNLFTKIGDSINLSLVYGDMGYMYSDYGSDTKAIEYFIKSMKIADLKKNKVAKYRAVEYMIKTLKEQKENQKALEYSYQLEKYLKEIEDEDSLALLYFSMASTYNAIADYKKMFSFSAKSMVIAKKIDAKNTLAANYGLLARYHLTKKQIDDAYKYSKLEIEIRRQKIAEPAFTKSHIRFSEILLLKKDYRNGEIIGKDCYKKTLELGNVELILSAAKNLKNIYIATNDKIKALDFSEVQVKMMDSLNSVNSKNAVIKSLFKYETEKKEAQIKALSQQKQIAKLESQRQKIGLGLLGLAIVSILISGYLLFKRYKTHKQNELLRMQLLESSKTFEAEKKAAQSELKALKSQMNPHFIFNALNGIQEQFMFGDKVVANEQMGNFTALTRQILSVSGKKTITIATEIDLLTKYLELEKMRFETGFEYAISCSEKIDQDYDEIPPMIIQPFAENAIKHGLLHKLGDKKLNIFFDRSENDYYLLCTITDNGVGRQKSAEIKAKSFSKHESFSTQSISQRLDILKKEGVDDELVVYEDILDNDNLVVGTTVLVRIPVGE